MATSESSRKGDLQSQVLAGWNAIARHISKRVGVGVSASTARRMAQRERDPLPLKRWGGGTRPRVVADGHALDTWCDRQWVISRPDEEEAQRTGDASTVRTNGPKGDGEG
jgi:hypothetical protein